LPAFRIAEAAGLRYKPAMPSRNQLAEFTARDGYLFQALGHGGRLKEAGATFEGGPNSRQ
jgi:hypothetical protein